MQITSQHSLIKQFSIECRKPKAKVMTTAHQNEVKHPEGPMKSQSKNKQSAQSAYWMMGWR